LEKRKADAQKFHRCPANVVQEAALALWANFRQRALDIAILEINNKTDVKIEVGSIERAKHRRVTFVTFAIEEQVVPKGA